MSKKDLLERLQNPRSDAKPASARQEESSTRVRGEAVRRANEPVVRRKPAEEVPPPAAPVVRRRKAVDIAEPAPNVTRSEVQSPQVAAPSRPSAPVERDVAPPKVEAAPPAEAPPAPEPAPARPAQAVVAEVVEPPKPPVEVKAEAPVPAAPVVVAPPPVVVAPPSAPAASAPPSGNTRPPRGQAGPGEGRSPEGAARAGAPPEGGPRAPSPGGSPEQKLPDSPRFAGFGKAVVALPPGYDPANPASFRRRPEPAPAPAQAPAPPRGRRRAESTLPPPGRPDPRSQPSYPPPQPQMPSGPATGQNRRGRRGRAEAPQMDSQLGRGVRPRRRKGPLPAKSGSPGPKAQKRKIRVDNVVSVAQLAHELGVKAPVVIRQLMELGVMATITEMLDIETAAIVAAEFDYEVENVGFQEKNYLQNVAVQVEEDGLESRPPVVTVMGHVDHGKTTLLDAIRESRVAQGEAGGITQHIGAYQVEHDGQLVTFLDTPGHEAFSAMRAAGAEVTDIVVLVVAADDGVQPQTEEAINHAKAAEVPILVAINKMDKPGVNADAIKQRLAERGLVPEDWGGDTMFVPVSALKRQGIEELIEAVLLQAEVLDLKANPERHAEGVVIEAKMERGRGAVATVLVQKGTLRRGDHVVLGSAFGKVRAILDHKGKNLKEGRPSTPVELFGLSELPEVGDTMVVVANEKNARTLAEHRAKLKRDEALSNVRRKTAEDLFAQASAEVLERVLLVLKADVQGTLQALKGSLEKIAVEGAEVRLLHAAVGDISESDVNMAAANGAMLVGFNVNVDAKARQAASQLGVEPELYSIIYEVIGRVEAKLKGTLAPVFHLVRQGAAEVRQLFRISRIGTVAGSYVTEGKLSRNSHAKVLRRGQVVWEGTLSGLKRFKDDVREVAAGYECGISLDGFDEVVEGDIVECFVREQVVN